MPEPEPLPAAELFPKRLGWVIRKDNDARLPDVMHWGFPPSPKSRAPVTNVRNVARPFWRSALKNQERRCLVPVTDFCEWEVEPGSKLERWFSLPSGPIFPFARIWRRTEVGKSFAFRTCGYDGDPAAHAVGRVHPKTCPVIMQEEGKEHWLNGDVDTAYELATPFPPQLIKAI